MWRYLALPKSPQQPMHLARLCPFLGCHKAQNTLAIVVKTSLVVLEANSLWRKIHQRMNQPHAKSTNTVWVSRAPRRGNRLSAFQTFEVQIVCHCHSKTNVAVTMTTRSNVGYCRVFCKALGTSECMPEWFEQFSSHAD